MKHAFVNAGLKYGCLCRIYGDWHRIAGLMAVVIIVMTTVVNSAFYNYVQIRAEELMESDMEDGKAEVSANGPDIETPSAILMEAKTGQVIYEKDAAKQLAPASITKIMTLILIFDALESGQIRMEDPVTVSEYAASMGGSQVFLEEGEIQSVRTMIKCIAVASANDACVAL